MNIDLCQIYGLTEEAARLLRKNDGGGHLRCQPVNGEDYPEYLCKETEAGVTVGPQFEQLRASGNLTADAVVDGFLGPAFKHRKGKLYATGLERGNSSIERLFQTARNINIVLLLKRVVEDYINHILGHPLFKLDPSFAEQEDWYRPNWIALEFDLLYRWHGLCPDARSPEARVHAAVEVLPGSREQEV